MVIGILFLTEEIMSLTVTEALQRRAATNFFNPEKTLSAVQIKELVRLATLAPTAFNLQNWHFIAVQSPEAKQKLYGAAYNQQKIIDASVTFIICGELESHTRFDRVVTVLKDKGGLSEENAEVWKSKVVATHENNPTMQHNEAFRSASLAAMALMLAAEEQGLVSGPMSGFVPELVSSAFNLTANQIPVMLVAVGYAAEGNFPQSPRLDVDEVLTVV